MALLELVTLLSLLLYLVVSFNVGRARGRYKVAPPATDGNADFARYYRVQMNTLEQLAAFLPALWLFSIVWSAPEVAAVLGIIWIIGRILYARGYYQQAEKRFAGFVISLSATSLLLVGSLIGIIKNSAGW